MRPPQSRPAILINKSHHVKLVFVEMQNLFIMVLVLLVFVTFQFGILVLMLVLLWVLQIRILVMLGVTNWCSSMYFWRIFFYRSPEKKVSEDEADTLQQPLDVLL